MGVEVLILGQGEDPLVTGLGRRYSGSGECVTLSESELFRAPLAVEFSCGGVSGFLRGDREIVLQDLTAVVCRLPRIWWPPLSMHPQDQHFVFHETLASWAGILQLLDCRVVNRFPLGWWLRDPGPAERMREELAGSIGFGTRPVETGELNAFPEARGRSVSVYVAGEAVVPQSAEAIGPARWLEDRLEALFQWRERSGIDLCRLDFVPGEPLTLDWVETFPDLAGEPEWLAERIVSGVKGVLR